MTLTRLQMASMVTCFSALTAWYGYMFGREAARQELADKIKELRELNEKLRSGGHE
ncbi:unnamed protein product [Calypogeia fissa]